MTRARLIVDRACLCRLDGAEDCFEGVSGKEPRERGLVDPSWFEAFVIDLCLGPGKKTEVSDETRWEPNIAPLLDFGAGPTRRALKATVHHLDRNLV